MRINITESERYSFLFKNSPRTFCTVGLDVVGKVTLSGFRSGRTGATSFYAIDAWRNQLQVLVEIANLHISQHFSKSWKIGFIAAFSFTLVLALAVGYVPHFW